MASSSEPLLRASGESPNILWDAPWSTLNTLDSIDTDLCANELYTSDDAECASPSKRERLRSLGCKTRSRTKEILRIDDIKNEIESSYNGALGEFENNPAFNPRKIFGQQRTNVGSTLDEIAGNLQVAGSAFIHPKLYAKRKTATTLATTGQPYLSFEADRALLNA